MKKYLSYVVAAFFASSFMAVASPEMDAIQVKETAAWQAFKDKKADDFKKVVDHDVVAVYAQGISDLAKELEDMQEWDMRSFVISDFKAISDEKDVAVTSYKVTVQGTFGGKDASGIYNAGSVWKMENGAWLAIFHTNMPVAAAPDAQKKE